MQRYYAYIDESQKKHDDLGQIKYICCVLVPERHFIDLGLFLQNCWFYKDDKEIRRDLLNIHSKQHIDSQINLSQKRSIHFSQLDKNDNHKFNVANRWIRYFMGAFGSYPSQLGIKYNILGLVLNNIDKNYFDPSIQDESQIYARFLRTQIDFLQKGLKEDEIIEKIVHDKADNIEKQKNGYVYNYLLNQLSRISKNQNRINPEFQDDSLNSILKNSNLNIDSEESRNKVLNCYFLQLCDLLLGTHTHFVHEVQNDSLKSKLTETAAPLIDRLLTKPNNPNSSYKYKGAYHFSFFPKYKEFYDKRKGLDGSVRYELREDLFFTNINCKFPESKKNHKDLFQYLKNLNAI